MVFKRGMRDDLREGIKVLIRFALVFRRTAKQAPQFPATKAVT